MHTVRECWRENRFHTFRVFSFSVCRTVWHPSIFWSKNNNQWTYSNFIFSFLCLVDLDTEADGIREKRGIPLNFSFFFSHYSKCNELLRDLWQPMILQIISMYILSFNVHCNTKNHFCYFFTISIPMLFSNLISHGLCGGYAMHMHNMQWKKEKNFNVNDTIWVCIRLVVLMPIL